MIEACFAFLIYEPARLRIRVPKTCQLYKLNALGVKTPGTGTTLDLGIAIRGEVEQSFDFQVGVWAIKCPAQDSERPTLEYNIDDWHKDPKAVLGFLWKADKDPWPKPAPTAPANSGVESGTSAATKNTISKNEWDALVWRSTDKLPKEDPTGKSMFMWASGKSTLTLEFRKRRSPSKRWTQIFAGNP
jgi:hypothetical protein